MKNRPTSAAHVPAAFCSALPNGSRFNDAVGQEFPLCHVPEVVEEGLNNQLIVQEKICLCVGDEHRSFDNNPLLEQVLFGSSGSVLGSGCIDFRRAA